MPTLGQLNSVSQLQASDIIGLFSGMSQTTRRATLAQLVEFMQQNLEFPDPKMLTQYAGPTTNNFDISINSAGQDVHLILTPTAPFPTGNITLPPLASLVDGQLLIVNTTNAVTSFTFTLNGAFGVLGVPQYLPQFGSFVMAFDLPSANWYCIASSQVGPVTLDTPQTLTNKTLNSPVLNSPTITTAVLGRPVSGDLLNCQNLPVSTGLSGLAANMALFLGNATSAALAATLTDETGTGLAVFNNAATLLAPRLGTPFSGLLTNCTGLPIDTGVSGMAAGIAKFLASPTSQNLAAAVTDETGSGSGGVLVFSVNPTIYAIARGVPVTKTASFSMSALTENWVICNGSAAIVATLPSASAQPGREFMMKNIAAFAVTSASANVVPLAGGAPGTAIMPATPGAKVTLVSDGTNWIIMA